MTIHEPQKEYDLRDCIALGKSQLLAKVLIVRVKSQNVVPWVSTGFGSRHHGSNSYSPMHSGDVLGYFRLRLNLHMHALTQ